MRSVLLPAAALAVVMALVAASHSAAAGSATNGPIPSAAGSGGTSQYLTAAGPTPTTPKASLPGRKSQLSLPNHIRKSQAGSPSPLAASSPKARVQTLTSASTTSASAPGVNGRTSLITHDQEVAFNGVDLAPPDTQLAVGPTASLEAVNFMAEIRNRATNATTDFDLNAFFHVPAGFFFTDPKVVYDIAKGRWYLTGAAFDSSNDGYVLLAVSTSSDPSASWNLYVVLDQHNTQVFCDQPHLGFSDDKVAIACDQFNAQGFFMNDIWVVVDKNALLSASNSVTEYTHSFTDNNHFSIQPVYSMTSTTTQYMVFDPPGAQLGGFIAVTGNPATGVGWFEANMSIAPVSLPPRAPQQGSASTIDTGDLRFDSAVYRSGIIWTGGGDSCIPAGDTMQRACLRLVQANVTGFPLVTNQPTVNQDFDVGMFVLGSGDSLYYPALAMDASGTTYVSYTESSAADTAGLFASDILPGAPGAVDQTFPLLGGNGPYVGPASLQGGSRWGDYSAAAPDPLDAHSVWVGGEYAAYENSHLNDWGTAMATFSVPACSSAGIATMATSPSFPGPTVIFMGSSSGCWGTPQYRFRKLPPNGSWTTVQDYSSNSNYSWNTSQEQVLGTYRFEIDVRSQGFVNALDASATITFDLAAGCTSTTMSAAPPTSSQVGTTVTITGAASGPNCASPQFRFWIKAPGGSWVIVLDYGSTNTYTWSTPATAGTYNLSVHARASGSSLAYESFASIPYTLVPANCTSVTVSAAPASPQLAGTAVTITASASGCPNPRYEFWIQAPGGSWTIVQSYSSNATFNWNTTGKAPGTYHYSVWVRDTSSAASYDAYFPGTAYTLTTTACSSVTASAMPSSPQAADTTVTITASASG